MSVGFNETGDDDVVEKTVIKIEFLTREGVSNLDDGSHVENFSFPNGYGLGAGAITVEGNNFSGTENNY
jgi:hypothetical protein